MPALVTTSGTSLCYAADGPINGQPLVLVQGLSAQMIGWRRGFLDILTGLGFRVITFDNRDIGRSQKFPDEAYTVTDMARDTVELMDALEIDRFHLLGQSMGGMIAQEVAIQWPERVSTLTLFFTCANSRHIVGADAIAVRESKAPARTREEFVDQYVAGERPCASTAYPQDVEWIAELGGLMWDRCPDVSGVQRQSAAVSRSRDLAPLLPELDVPTLIVNGSADQLIAPAASVELHTLIPGATLHTFDGMGHEFPEPLWQEFGDLIARNCARAPLSD